VSTARPSSLPETDLARISRWVERENERIPPDARDQVRVEADFDERSVTILECRPPWDPERVGPEWTRVPVPGFATRGHARSGPCTGRIGTLGSTSTTLLSPRPTLKRFFRRSIAIPRRSSGDDGLHPYRFPVIQSPQ
jgi:hypothetical protein